MCHRGGTSWSNVWHLLDDTSKSSLPGPWNRTLLRHQVFADLIKTLKCDHLNLEFALNSVTSVVTRERRKELQTLAYWGQQWDLLEALSNFPKSAGWKWHMGNMWLFDHASQVSFRWMHDQVQNHFLFLVFVTAIWHSLYHIYVSLGCYNEFPHVWWLKTPIYPLMVLQSKNLEWTH